MAFPNLNLNQKAVYWGNPTTDGYGAHTFDEPVEIDCRWSNSTKLIRTVDNEELVCIAEVQVDQDLEEGGMLYLGTLDDFDSAEGEDPYSMQSGRHAYIIKRFDKIPTIKGTRFFRKAYL